jgi:hypothetical protein
MKYHASIKILGRFIKATGDTAFNALLNLKPNGPARGVTVLTVKHGNISKEIVLNRIQTARLFNPNPEYRKVALLNIAARFEI